MGPDAFTPVLTNVNVMVRVFSGRSGGGRLKGVFVNFSVLVTNVSLVDSSVGSIQALSNFSAFLTSLTDPVVTLLMSATFANVVRSSTTAVNVIRTLTLANNVA